MLDKVVGISIEGKCFEKQQHLALFVETDENDKFKKNKGNNKYRISILYGKNGSGKTTISKAFLNIIQQPTDDTFKCHLLDENENKIELINPNEKIFVFNDDYIVKNIKINDDGLESIVLVGKQVALQNKIEKFQKYLTIIDKQIEQVDNTLENYQEKKAMTPIK